MVAGRSLELFPREEPSRRQVLGDGAVLLRGLVCAMGPVLLEAVEGIAAVAPFRHMKTRSGLAMSAAMTNAGAVGWVSDARGYRYAESDPEAGRAWPPIPPCLQAVAADAAAIAGFPSFVPDACLVNRYTVGARMGLHQDRDERDFTAPIVSVSLGLPIVFLWGGATRAERPVRVPLEHGDVVVFGGPARLRFHGVLPLADGAHPLTGQTRINVTFRKAR